MEFSGSENFHIQLHNYLRLIKVCTPFPGTEIAILSWQFYEHTHTHKPINQEKSYQKWLSFARLFLKINCTEIMKSLISYHTSLK